MTLLTLSSSRHANLVRKPTRKKWKEAPAPGRSESSSPDNCEPLHASLPLMGSAGTCGMICFRCRSAGKARCSGAASHDLHALVCRGLPCNPQSLKYESQISPSVSFSHFTRGCVPYFLLFFNKVRGSLVGLSGDNPCLHDPSNGSLETLTPLKPRGLKGSQMKQGIATQVASSARPPGGPSPSEDHSAPTEHITTLLHCS